MQRNNVFQEAMKRLKAFRNSQDYSPEERLLVDSGFYAQIGGNIIDSMLRRLACTYFEAEDLRSKYEGISRTIYRVVSDHHKVTEGVIRECAAYAFLNREMGMLAQLEEVLGTLLFDANELDQTEQLSSFSDLNEGSAGDISVSADMSRQGTGRKG